MLNSPVIGHHADLLSGLVSGAEVPPLVTFTLGEPRPLRRPESRAVAAGAPLFVDGLDGAETARIVEGAVCLCRQAGDGSRRVIDILGPGYLVGSFLTALPGCNVVALTRTRLVAVAALEEAAGIAEATRTMLRRAQAHAMLLRRNAVSERLAICLLDLAGQFGPGLAAGEAGETTFTLHLTRADLADWLGLTLTSVSRGLNAFKRAGIVAFDHPKVITIRDRAALSALASERGEPARRRLPEAKAGIF